MGAGTATVIVITEIPVPTETEAARTITAFRTDVGANKMAISESTTKKSKSDFWTDASAESMPTIRDSNPQRATGNATNPTVKTGISPNVTFATYARPSNPRTRSPTKAPTMKTEATTITATTEKIPAAQAADATTVAGTTDKAGITTTTTTETKTTTETAITTTKTTTTIKATTEDSSSGTHGSSVTRLNLKRAIGSVVSVAILTLAGEKFVTSAKETSQKVVQATHPILMVALITEAAAIIEVVMIGEIVIMIGIIKNIAETVSL